MTGALKTADRAKPRMMINYPRYWMITDSQDALVARDPAAVPEITLPPRAAMRGHAGTGVRSAGNPLSKGVSGALNGACPRAHIRAVLNLLARGRRCGGRLATPVQWRPRNRWYGTAGTGRTP